MLKDPKNIFLIIFIVSFIFLILDFLIFKTHQQLEHFEDQKITIKKLNIEGEPSISPDSIIPSEIITPSESHVNKKNKKAKDISFLTDINNEDLSISDFYPTHPEDTTKLELVEFVYETDLFQQIIPKFSGGYIGIIWFDNRINGIYHTTSLIKKDWASISNSIPENMLRPVFITFDKDKKLLGIFEDNTNEKRRFHLYKKTDIDINSEWEFIEKDKIVSLIYDTDQILIGLDLDGFMYKKSSHLLEGSWEFLDNNKNQVPMRKLLFDYRDGYMFGLTHNFQVYRKKGLDWKTEDWDTYTLPKSLTGTVRDIWFDFDGYMLGLSRIGLVKKESGNYLSNFRQYKEEVIKKAISIYDVMYSITGIKTFASMEDMGNNSNNVYVGGKKISEYKFKDPKLNQYLDHRMNLKKQCRKMKALKLRDLENTSDAETRVRNNRFINILDEQKDIIGDLYDSIQDLKDRHY